MHSIQIHKVISMITFALYVIGIWHSGDKPTVKERRVKWFYCIYYALLVISVGVGAITNENMDNSILLAKSAMAASVLTIKLWILIWKQNETLDLLNRVCVFSIRNEDDYNHSSNKLRSFAKFVLVFVIATTLIGALASVVSPFIGNEKKLFLEIAFPLDWKNNEAAFWIANIFLITWISLSTIVASSTVLIWYLLLNCSLRYDVLGGELKNMGQINEKGKVKVTEKQMHCNFNEDLKESIKTYALLRECVTVFDCIIQVPSVRLFFPRLTSEVESLFSDIFFIQFGTSGLCICGSTYCLAFDVGDNPIERFIHVLVFFYFIAELFMITYFGNEIKLSSDHLSYCLFESDWYNQPQSTKKNIIIFGECLMRPQELVIAKLYTLTLETFTRILNSAYSMFNILKSFQQ